MPSEATFFTVSDAHFFQGTVALLNSLRLTGHPHEMVVLDGGLDTRQREVLAKHVTIVERPVEQDRHPVTVKAFPALMETDGVVVIIDSDIVVTDSLDPILELARSGRLCLFPDHPWSVSRWCPEWEEIFDLSGPPRRQPYMNSGFIALADPWKWLLRRWWKACGRIPAGDVFTGDYDHPLYAGDQDALNAILMSEVPRASVAELPRYADIHTERPVIESAESLICTYRGRRQPMIHATQRPKVWQRSGWRQVRANAYVQVLPRLLYAEDVLVRLRPDDLPLWVRPGRAPRAVVRTLGALNAVRALSVRARRAPRKVARLASRAVPALRSA